MTGMSSDAVSHPALVPWIQRLDTIRSHWLSGHADIWTTWRALMDWCHALIRRLRRWHYDYILESDGQPIWLQPDDLPLKDGLECLWRLIERLAPMEQTTVPETLVRAWIDTVETLIPWVVHGGKATVYWYRCILATYEWNATWGERLLHRLYVYGQRTPHPEHQRLIRGALDYFRIIRSRGGQGT